MCIEHLKEETWNLELSKQELTSQVTDLQQDLSRITSDYARASKQVNDLRQDIERMQDKEEKLNGMVEDMKTRHQHDMSTIRRQYASVQREKLDQQKQIDALTSELAIARAHSRITKRRQQDTPALGIDEADSVSPETSGNEKDAYRNSPNTTSSPPSSPKQTPTRNQALELDTLKASLAHAHRMVSNLRSNLHKEKMEKFELRKLLSESQETIEQLQNDPASWIDQPSSSQRTQRKTRRRKASGQHKVSRPTAIAAGGGLMSGKSDVDDEEDGGKESEWSEEEEDEGPLSPEPLSLDPAFQVLQPQQTLADQLSAAIEHHHHPMETTTTADVAIQTCGGEYEDMGVQTDKPRWQSRSMPGTGVYPRIGNSIYTQTMPSSYTDHVVTCMKCGGTTLSSSHSNATFVSDNKTSSPSSSSNNSNVQAERSSGIVEPSTVAASAAEPKTLTQAEADAMIAAALAPYKSLQKEQQQPPNPKAQAPILTTTTNTNTTTTFTTHHHPTPPPQQHHHPMEDTDEEESDDEAAATTTTSSVRVANNNTNNAAPSILLSKATTASSRATASHLSRSDSNNHGVVYVKPQTTVATCYLNNNGQHQRRASESGSISTFSESKLSLAPYNNNLSLQQPDTMDTATTTASSSSIMNGVGDGGSGGSSAIALITQTMIGDWMWKYTRKAVGNGISERRHKRFFWIHPYTRTLYWSAHAPGMDGREVRAKSGKCTEDDECWHWEEEYNDDLT